MLEIKSRVLIGEDKKREDEEHYLPTTEYTFPQQKSWKDWFLLC
jgi:hypothetical protein